MRKRADHTRRTARSGASCSSTAAARACRSGSRSASRSTTPCSTPRAASADRVRDRAAAGVAVGDHGEAAQAEQIGAAVGVRVEPRAQPRAPPAGSAGRRASRARWPRSPRAARRAARLIVPSSSFSATLPVKPSVTTTSAAPREQVAASALPAKSMPGASRQQRVRLDRELVALLGLLADREQPHGRARRSRGSPAAKTAPMIANWSRCSGRLSAFAPASISTDGAAPRRDRDGDRRPQHAGQRAAGGGARRRASRRCSRPRRPRRPRPRRPRARRATSEESGFARTASAGFSAISIAVRRSHELRARRCRARPGRRG